MGGVKKQKKIKVHGSDYSLFDGHLIKQLGMQYLLGTNDGRVCKAYLFHVKIIGNDVYIRENSKVQFVARPGRKRGHK